MNLVARIRTYGSMVAFTHTVFALPFAASAVVLAQAEPHVSLNAARVLAMLVCMVSARTSAMAFNRWADRDPAAALLHRRLSEPAPRPRRAQEHRRTPS